MKKKAPHHPATLPGVWELPETDPRRCEYEQRERQWLRDHTGTDRTAAAYQAAMDTVACELVVRPQRHSFLEGPEWVETLEGIPARWSRSQILDYKKRVEQGQRVAWRRTYTDGRPAETVYQPVEDAREPKRFPQLKPGAPRKFTLASLRTALADYPDSKVSNRVLAVRLTDELGTPVTPETVRLRRLELKGVRPRPRGPKKKKLA